MRLLVLGGGPAGLNAALQGRELGAQVILIESDRLGGTSINRGPTPVRTLARAARLVRRIIVAVGGHPGRLPAVGPRARGGSYAAFAGDLTPASPGSWAVGDET
jgi:pyruvate/2-oxoglutarate dehydrogenase complex dihydrolipoamide dehydrogenase (E3) component